MDDNATCHRTLAVQDCLDSEGIQRLVWPARSPDLNPIENVWDALGRQVAGLNYPPTNKNTLIRALTEEWDKLPQQLLDNVVQSMQLSSSVVWSGIGYHSRTPLIRIAGTLNSHCDISEMVEPVVLPYLQGLATAIFQQDKALPHVERIDQWFFVNHQIELLPWPARSPDLSLIENMWSMVAQRLTRITPPAATLDQLWQRVEAAWSAVPQEHIQSLFESMPRRVAAVISNNGGYSGY
ncbi:transposable element Tcb1 transposase [Trichonephila clavipes]|nr:transposable element Tcb1 transposase [Trichonephila clavipes]